MQEKAEKEQRSRGCSALPPEPCGGVSTAGREGDNNGDERQKGEDVAANRTRKFELFLGHLHSVPSSCFAMLTALAGEAAAAASCTELPPQSDVVDQCDPLVVLVEQRITSTSTTDPPGVRLLLRGAP